MNLTYSKSRALAWSIWMIASLFYAYQYILRVMPNIMIHDIMQKFNMNASLFGQFSGIYYIGYSLVHIPVGILLDRYGPRKVMAACIFLTVLGTFPLLFTNHWAYPLMGRFLIGIGASAAILGVFKIIRMTFSEKKFPRMLSFSVTIGLVGAIYGGAPVSSLLDMFGYQFVVQLFIGIGLILAFTTYWIVPDDPSSFKQTVGSKIKEVFSNSKVILSCLFAGLMVGTLEGFADVWGTVFFKQVYHFDSVVASTLPSTIYLGMCFGAPILSFIADKIGNYLVTIIAVGIAMTIGFSSLLFSQLPLSFLTINLIIIGICCAYQILAIYKASTYTRAEVAGLTTAVANMIIMVFGYVFHAFIGYIVNKVGGPNSSKALIYGLMTIPCALGLGLGGFMLLFFKERAETSRS